MKKYLLIYCLAFLIPLFSYADVNVKDGTAITTGSEIDGCSGVAVADGQTVKSTGGYCAGQGWNTLTDFRLDFDHTDDNKNACTPIDTETGTLTNATIADDGITSPLSGGDSLLCDGDNHIITFDGVDDSGTTYFNSKWGTLYFSIVLAGDNTNEHDIVNIIQTAAEDRLEVILEATGKFFIIMEGQNNGTVSHGHAGFDMDNYYDKLVQGRMKWDSTRCTDGTCDGAGEDEIKIALRVDDNADGDFDDGGVEDWNESTSTDADDLPIWAAEPGVGDFKFGIVNGVHTQNIKIDDIEISGDQPAW